MKKKIAYQVSFRGITVPIIATSVGNAVTLVFREFGWQKPKSDRETGGWIGVGVEVAR